MKAGPVGGGGVDFKQGVGRKQIQRAGVNFRNGGLRIKHIGYILFRFKLIHAVTGSIFLVLEIPYEIHGKRQIAFGFRYFAVSYCIFIDIASRQGCIIENPDPFRSHQSNVILVLSDEINFSLASTNLQPGMNKLANIPRES